jgi:hypothetical protein
MLLPVHAVTGKRCYQYMLLPVHAATDDRCTLLPVNAVIGTRCYLYTLLPVHDVTGTCCYRYTLQQVTYNERAINTARARFSRHSYLQMKLKKKSCLVNKNLYKLSLSFERQIQSNPIQSTSLIAMKDYLNITNLTFSRW